MLIVILLLLHVSSLPQIPTKCLCFLSVFHQSLCPSSYFQFRSDPAGLTSSLSSSSDVPWSNWVPITHSSGKRSSLHSFHFFFLPALHTEENKINLKMLLWPCFSPDPKLYIVPFKFLHWHSNPPANSKFSLKKSFWLYQSVLPMQRNRNSCHFILTYLGWGHALKGSLPSTHMLWHPIHPSRAYLNSASSMLVLQLLGSSLLDLNSLFFEPAEPSYISGYYPIFLDDTVSFIFSKT